MTSDEYDEAIRNGIVAFFAKYLPDTVLERILADRTQQSGGATVHELRSQGRPPTTAGGRSDDRSGGRTDGRADPGKPVSSSQVQRLEKIRDGKRLWAIIDERCTDRKVDRFDELTYDEAAYALDSFYENSGGGRPAAGGRR